MSLEIPDIAIQTQIDITWCPYNPTIATQRYDVDLL